MKISFAGYSLLYEILCILSTNGFLLSIPQNKQLVYKFTSSISAGTNTHVPHASEFYLQGNLHMQGHSENSILVYFSNLSYKIYNGEVYYRHENKLKEIQIPKQNNIYKEFEIYYHLNGKMKGISKISESYNYLNNIKKAIASILQLNIENIDLTKNGLFTTNENLIYGENIPVAYNILIGTNDKIFVEKHIELEINESLLKSLKISFEFDYCDANFEKPISQDSIFNYTIVNLKDGNGQKIIEKIETYGKIYTYLLRGNLFNHHIITKQIFELIDTVPAKHDVRTDITKEIPDCSLPDFNLLNGITNNYYQKSSFQEKLSKINIMLEMILKNRDTNKELSKQGDLINELINLLTILDYAILEKIAYKTEDKYLEIFYHLLPMIGSRASIKLIKKLIHEKVVQDDIASNMLQNFPFYIREPSEEILEDIEEFLHWKDQASRRIQKDALLCFSVVIYKSFKRQLRLHYHPDTYERQTDSSFHYYQYISVTNEEMSFFDTHKIYLKYVDAIGHKLKSEQDFELQAMYCFALFNTRIYKIAEYLIPIILDKNNQNHKIQTSAAAALSSVIYQDNTKLFEFYFPIFTDISRPIELRTAAYYFTMESHPSFSLLLKVHNHIEHESNQELYHYHYNYLKTLSTSTELCHQQFKLDVEKLLRYMRKPNHQSLSGFYQADYRDTKYGFGGGFHYFLFDLGSSKIIFSDSNWQSHNLNRYTSISFTQIYGFESEHIKNLNILNLSSEKLWNVMKEIGNMKNLHVDILFAHHDLIIEFNHYNNKNITKFFDILKCVTSKNSLQIYYDLFAQLHLSTDLGFPVSVEVLTPVIYQKQQNFISERNNKIQNFQIDNRYRFSKYAYYGLSFYNPFIDSWQGISRSNWNSFVIPLYADIYFNLEEDYIKFSLKKHKEDEKNVIGVEGHTFTQTFLKGNANSDKILLKSCPYCEQSFTVFKKGQIKENRIITKIPEIGYKYDVLVYDSQGHINFKWPKQLLTTFTNDVVKSYQSPAGFIAIFVNYWYAYSTLLPESTGSGFSVKALPLNQINFKFQIKKEISNQENVFMPNLKLGIYGNYSLLNGNEAVEYWNLTAETEMKTGHKMKITNITLSNKSDFKVCIHSVKNWNVKEVNSQTIISLSCNDKNAQEDNTINIDMIGERSELQNHLHYSYEICQPYTNELEFNYHPVYCTAAHDSVRKYNYSIRTKNISKKYQDVFSLWFDHLKEWYASSYSTSYNNKKHPSNNIINLEYSLQENLVDLNITTPERIFKFSSISTRNWKYLGFYPDTCHHSEIYTFMHAASLVRKYYINLDSVKSYEWKMCISVDKQKPRFGIYLKREKTSDLLALKIIFKNSTLKIYPTLEEFQYVVVINGKEETTRLNGRSSEWFTYVIDRQTSNTFITLHHQIIMSHIKYNRYEFYVEVPIANSLRFLANCFKL